MKAEQRTSEFRFYVCSCQEDDFTLPWGKEGFDVFVLILNESLLKKDKTIKLLEELILLESDWFEVIGNQSEFLHDTIDQLSVSLGRQKAVGDGSPMTAWHNEITEPKVMAEYIYEFGHGGHDNRAILLIGNTDECNIFFEEFMKES